MMLNIEDIKNLREETEMSIMEVRSALEETKGDKIKALEILKKRGAQVAEKKAERETKQGAIFSYVHHNKRIGSLVSVLCETDFVAMNADFQQLGNDIAMHIASTAPESTDALLQSPFIKDPSLTVAQLIKNEILRIGENITIGDFSRFEI